MSAKLPPPFDRLSMPNQSPLTVKAGDTLFLQGQPTAGLFYVISGDIQLSRVTESGHSVIIHRAGAGETIAEASLFSPAYHCTATASSDTCLIECNRPLILECLRADGQFALLLAERFATQIQESRRRVEILSVRAADERILIALNDGLLVNDIASFAQAIALAPETVYRILSQLKKKGVVEKTARGRYRLAARPEDTETVRSHLNTDPVP